ARRIGGWRRGQWRGAHRSSRWRPPDGHPLARRDGAARGGRRRPGAPGAGGDQAAAAATGGAYSQPGLTARGTTAAAELGSRRRCDGALERYGGHVRPTLRGDVAPQLGVLVAGAEVDELPARLLRHVEDRVGH